MTITSYLLEAYLKCPTKCWLRSAGKQIMDSTCVQTNESYATAEIRRLLSKTHQGECMISPSADNLKAGKWRLATDVLAQTPHLESHLHAVECLPSEDHNKPAQFIPIRFVPTNKLSKDTKLVLAFDALALSEMLGQEVTFGKIIHGDKHATECEDFGPGAQGAAAYSENRYAVVQPFITKPRSDPTLRGMRVSNPVPREGTGE